MNKLIRYFSTKGQDPFDSVSWERRVSEITDDSGKVIFKQPGVEVPVGWSDLAVKVVVSKYFYGDQSKPERENSVRQLIHRVCRTIADWAVKDNYLSEEDGSVFYDELVWLTVNQHMAFNSPVWFNVGLFHVYGVGTKTRGNYYYDSKLKTAKRAESQYEYPQCSACFINSVEDNMESIMKLASTEAALFKFGSGTGTDLTPIRSSREKLSGGGKPSGPLSFLRIYDQVANVVKSGGKTRRAAKMNTLFDWHGDIEEFITAKTVEEKKAHALIDQGYEGNFNGPAYGTVAFQNENLSVRVSDEFMRAAVNGGEWWTKSVITGDPIEKKNAGALLSMMAEGAWFCGDPGIQFDGTIQEWHTCAGTEPIYSTNPCSEYVFINNTACNLASLNLMKFRSGDGSFDVDGFVAAVELTILAQEILVDNSSYPTAEIAENSHIFRTLGLGYANLGSLIMSYGLAYDSDDARELAASITSLMTASAYSVSAKIASNLGPFLGYNDSRCAHRENGVCKDNAQSMGKVIHRHLEKSKQLGPSAISRAAQSAWSNAVELGDKVGYRNAQVTVLAPTGTIAFMMDCSTTGIEPDIALVKYKTLAGGGNLKIVNNTVPVALEKLGYSGVQITEIVQHIEKYDTIEDVKDVVGVTTKSGLKPEHLTVFDCAFRPSLGQRSIHYMAHIKIMAMVQPFISGAISKTVNMPNSATVEEVKKTYIEAWKMGLKCVAIYRDGSKRSQPLKTSKNGPADPEELSRLRVENADLIKRLTSLGAPVRRRLPPTRAAITHKFEIGVHEGYITVGKFEDGSPGETFITMAKEGSTIGGLVDTIATLISISLQYGVPLDMLVDKFSHHRFEPAGYTKNPNVKYASSVVDYVFRWLKSEFLKEEVPAVPGPSSQQMKHDDGTKSFLMNTDAPSCPNCGHIAVRSGSCFKCMNCGESLGCS